LGFENGEVFREPLVEFFYKNDALNDPLITDDHIKLLNIATDKDIETLKTKALEINQVLKQLMDAMNLKLVDYKIEFGKTETDQILIA
uniref:phosphoribosylaminoimidazolesuccinocarboxamide synthase n=1 Tax=Staphylococcus aureus TaxID=1280 RepID=UPI0026EB5782